MVKSVWPVDLQEVVLELTEKDAKNEVVGIDAEGVDVRTALWLVDKDDWVVDEARVSLDSTAEVVASESAGVVVNAGEDEPVEVGTGVRTVEKVLPLESTSICWTTEMVWMTSVTPELSASSCRLCL